MFSFFKKKEISINNKKVLVDTMAQIIEVLKNNGYPHQAQAIENPLNYLIKDNTSKFVNSLNTVDIWGGSGSVWEVDLTPPEEEQMFMQLMVVLIDNLKTTGIEIPRAKRIEKLFKNELKRK